MTCDCKKFRLKKDDEGHCLECGHRISKHPDADLQDVAGVHLSSVPLPLAHLLTENTPWDIFKGVTRTSGMVDPSNLSVQAAREEALSTLAVAKQSGYQKLAKGSAPVAQKVCIYTLLSGHF